MPKIPKYVKRLANLAAIAYTHFARIYFQVFLFTTSCFIVLAQDETQITETQVIPVKRLLSRHRRFIAPGTRWDWLAGFETISGEFEIRFYLMVRYSLDYLFGGFNALAAEIASQDAAFVASKAAKEAVQKATGGAGGAGGIFKKRGHMNDSNTSQVRRRTKRTVVDCDDNVDNVLTRTNVHDQIEIFQRIEHSLDQTGYPGQKCLLRVICELHETPIHDTSIVGEMMTKFFKPRASRNKKLDIYQEAADIGEHGGNCSDHFKACPVSIFNIIPSFAADGEDIQVSFDPVEAGSKTTKGVDSDLEDVYKNPNFFESFQVYPTF